MIDSKRTSVRFFCLRVRRIWCAGRDGRGIHQAQSVAVVQVCGVSRAHQVLTQ